MLQLDQLGDPLRIVTTAVAPVVMVSATAILIGSANSRYVAISDRIRNLAHEYRGEEVTARARPTSVNRSLSSSTG